MIIASLCENPDVLRIFKMIKISINVIKIVVPLLLIISLMLDFIKPMLSDKKDELTISGRKAIKRIIAAILIFFIPTFVNILLEMANKKDIGYSACFANANNVYIANSYVKEAQNLIDIANKTEDRTDYNRAEATVDALLYNKIVVSVLNEKGSGAGAFSNVDVNSVGVGNDSGIVDYKVKPATTGPLKLKENINSMKAQLSTVKAKVEKKEEELKKNRDEQTEKRKKRNAKLSVSRTGFAWPLADQSRLTACFGGNDSTHKAIGGGHGAIDMACAAGTPVYASKAGKVIYSNYPGTYKSSQGYSTDYIIKNCYKLGNGGCANKVQIEHSNGVTTTYCHLLTNSITVKQGEYVKQGDKIGEVGSTGCSTGPHLHFAVNDGSKRDPLNYVKPYNVTNPNRCGIY